MSAAATPDPEASPDAPVEPDGDPRALVHPQVSVLVPCWNAAASIGRALDSVLVDRDLPLECVVVDDGSTDGTADVVRSIARRDPRVVLVVSPANEGVSAARNRGLGVVRGTWLTFLDADDRLLPGGLAAMYDAATRTDALAVVGQRIWSDGAQTWISGHYDVPDIRVPGRKSLVASPGLLAYASATGKLVHRTCREDLWFSGRVLGDQPWTIRALLRAGDRIEVIDTVVYEWTRPRPGIELQTITAAKHRSARLAAEAVRVAIGAYTEVADEAARILPDVAGRRVIAAGYFDRLVRSDFAGPVSRAAASGDEGSAELYGAIVAFLSAAPPDIAGRSRVVMRALVLPPLLAWRTLAPEGRAAAWSMVDTIGAITRATPGLSRRRRGAWRLLAGLSAAWHGPARPLVDALLWVLSLAPEARRSIRARRRRPA
jgi:hypothetical protein